ncbi:TRAP transporter substrate-binding protein [Geobacillus zalihae]|uniref:TRAP transporter substrate-binding protein n=1 Tax=Geobacillus zalihae TaxID=213419 RepID=UPI001F60E95C|nr:TRAP transporter substrate-binding protein [Geobacillus zalihae]
MSIKRVASILLALFMLSAIFLAGCSSSSSQQSSEQKSGQASSKKIVIKFGHGAAETNPRHQAALKFKELVEEKSKGQIEVQVFPGEQLGSEPAMLQAVQSNTLQMTAVGTGIYSSLYQPIGIVELPYLFDSFEQAWKVLDGPFGQELAKPLIDKNIHILAYWENGFRHVTNNVKPIQTPDDLKGLKIRTPEIPVSVSIFKTLGANPTPMAFGELFQALEQHIVDGQENPLTNIYNSKLYEVQKFLSLTGHQYSPLPLAISEKFWKTLSPEQQKIIEESAKEAGQFHREAVKADDQKLRQELEKKGMKINEVDQQAFKNAVQPVYKEFEKVYGKELMDQLFEAIKETK